MARAEFVGDRNQLIYSLTQEYLQSMTPELAVRIGKLVEPAVIARAQTGDHTAFAVIFKSYWNPIYNYVYRMMDSPEDAADFTQETFMKVYSALPRTSHDLKIRAWIYRIATNACLDELRHRKLIKWQSLYDQSENLSDLNQFMNYIPRKPNDEPLPIASSDRATDPEAAFLAKEDYEEIQAILDRLYPKYRVCLILFHYQDFLMMRLQKH